MTAITGRRLALVFGVLAFVGAIAISAGVVAVPLDGWVVLVVGLLATGIGIVAVFRRRGVRRQADTPTPEQRTPVPAPGATVSDAIGEFRTMAGEYSTGSRRIASGLRLAAIAALTRFGGYSAEEAADRIDDGSWTDDATAAAFLSEKKDTSASLGDWLPRLLNPGRDTSFQAGVRHAVAAIAAIGYTTEDADTDDDSRSLPAYADERIDRTSGDSRTSARSISGVESTTQRPTNYWTGIGVVALFAVGIGALAESPGVVLAGVVGVGYAGFSRAFEPPELELAIARELSDDDPEPGDEIDVVVTITNESGRFVPDLRLVDGVPPGLAVVDGSNRLGTALRPHESVSLEYTVAVRRGTHEFDPALAIVRDLSRSREREFLVGSETTVVCEPVLRPIEAPVPLRATAASFAGRLTTDEGGAGTTFHSVREYRAGDPLSRVDWNRRAKTGELATLEFHEERAARVVVLIDARKAAFLAPDPDGTHAVDRSVAAAGRIAASLLADGDTVGLAALGPIGREFEAGAPTDGDPCWLAPASGRHHEIHFQDLLATHPQFDSTPPRSESRWLPQLRTIRRRLSAETQIVLLTPLCDTGAVTIARRLESRGHPVTVVSPDPTADRTAGQQLSAVARRIRQFDLQRIGIPVIDWPADETIDDVFARYARAGGRA
ncbi:DUF58 domain-containing protein [Halopiger aswanensis]|uniref:Uncharacterized protein (DUF58 family) n=1 Tax=Halopiger aswanensis TaxID=148449 RepID=A0A3R7D9Q5_9EURY|nr:DUF58 domain-containing protein [Halopiger aswanensis]RKD94946.1 uncharacterized protein (DUF58 family) [Halopiger aswanensis]